MARPLRINDPESLQLITVRTQSARLLLQPSRSVNEMIGGVLARYQEIFNIEIFAYAVLSNHYHLLLRAPEGNLWRFMQAVNREIARRINFHLKREGSVWGRRYDAQLVVEETDELEALLYVVCNSVNHGLESHPKKWPGLSCYQQLRHGGSRKFRFTHYSQNYDSDKLASKNRQTIHFLTLSPLPSPKYKTLYEQWRLIEQKIQQRLADIRRDRGEEKYLSKAKILKQSPFSRPREIKRSPRPICYTKSLAALRWFQQFYRALRKTYLIASYRYRSGESLVEFPEYTFPPPGHYVPA